MRIDGDFADFALHSNEGGIYPCHKVVLASHSQYWRKLLKSEYKEVMQGYVELDYSNEAIEIILRQTYMPEKKPDITHISFELYAELFNFADLSLDESLKDFLNKVSLEPSDNDNLEALQFANFYNDNNLTDKVLNNIKNNYENKDIDKYIIKMVKEENELIFFGLEKIIGSVFFNHLCENNYELLIGDQKFKDILNLENLSKDEIESMLSMDNYNNIINNLLQDLENKLLMLIKDMKINSPAQLASFFVAHEIINLSLPRNTAIQASQMAIGFRTWTIFYDVNTHRNWNEARYAANMVIQYENVFRPANMAANKAAGVEVMNIILNSTKNALSKALPKLELNNPIILSEKSWQLAKLFALAYINQNFFQKLYFLKAYNAALNVLENDNKFNLSKSEILDKIGKHTWLLSEKLAINPFIASLKRMLEAILDK